jgi:methanogenic corrinoid protein MtbC1
MNTAELFSQYLEHLFAGKRCEARELVFAAQDRGVGAAKLLQQIIWPAMEQVEKLYRENHVSMAVEHMATRINRMIADQLGSFLARGPKSGKRMIVCCGDGEIEELGAQIVGDLFEAQGWSVWFIGAGVASDEIFQLMGKLQPDVVCLYGTVPQAVPGTRKLIQFIRQMGAFQDLQILVVGGVFNRAEGLADEIKADLYAKNATEALAVVNEHPVRVPKLDTPEPGRRRKRRNLQAHAMKPLRMAAVL